LIHSFIYISQNTVEQHERYTVVKLFRRTERPVALTTTHIDARNTKHKASQ